MYNSFIFHARLVHFKTVMKIMNSQELLPNNKGENKFKKNTDRND